MRLGEICAYIGASLAREGHFKSLGFLGTEMPEALSVIYDPNFLDRLLANSHITSVLTTPDLLERLPAHLGVAVCASPLDAFFVLHGKLAAMEFYGANFETEIDSTADVHPTAFVASRNVRIGPNVRIDPNVTVLERTIIGEGCVLRPGVVVGSEGFEVRDVGGRRTVVPHTGGVKLGSRVHLQANTSVSRSLFGGFTEIGDDSATDNLVHVAHAVRIGKRCRIAAAAMIAGSTIIGDDVWIGPNATLSNGIRIGDRATISLGAVVTRDVSAGAHVSGHFAIEHARFIAFMRGIR